MKNINCLRRGLTQQEMNKITGGKKVLSFVGYSAERTEWGYYLWSHYDEYTVTIGGKLKDPTGNTYSQIDESVHTL